MAGSVNKVILIGRLGSDPELNFTSSGQAVGKLSIATTEGWMDKNSGQWQEKTEWHRVIAWGKLAEKVKEYLSKGRLVYVEGRLQTRSYEDKNGVKKYTTEIVARTIQFLDSGRGGGQGSADEAPLPDDPGPARQEKAAAQEPIEDEKIPF